MILRSLLVRRKSFFNNLLHQCTPHQLSSSHRLLVQNVVSKLRRQDFCTAADDKRDDKGGEEGNDKGEAFRKKIDQLRELKRQIEELDKNYDSYFTVDYALDLARKGFKDSEDDEFVDSSDSENSSLEVICPSKEELFSNDDDDDFDP
eukprot:c18594_g1_i1 orf=544-987(+)